MNNKQNFSFKDRVTIKVIRKKNDVEKKNSEKINILQKQKETKKDQL